MLAFVALILYQVMLNTVRFFFWLTFLLVCRLKSREGCLQNARAFAGQASMDQDNPDFVPSVFANVKSSPRPKYQSRRQEKSRFFISQPF